MQKVLLRLGCLFACYLSLALPVLAESPRKVATVEGVSEYRFDNGARVLLFPEPSRPTITVNMTVLVGSRHEGYGEAGMAHLLEHMVFKGTPTFPDVPTALRDHGASFNGTTNQDRTNYFETLPATDENLEFAIHLEADRLVNSFVRREDLLSEFSVVRNEFERGENSPEGVLMQRVMSAAYEWHNYGKSTIGNRSDIERVPIDRLQDFYRKYYQPDNVVLIVAGRFEEEKALAILDKYLGSIPKPERKLALTYTEEPAQDGERMVKLQRVGKVGSVMAVYHMPAASHEDWAPLTILGTVLSEDKVGLLEKVLVEPGIATSAGAGADSSHDPGLFMFSATPREDNLAEVQELLLKTLDGIPNENFDPEAINRAKLRAKRRAELMMTNASGVASQLSSASALGDWRLMFLQRDRIQEVTVDEVSRVAKQYFLPHNRTFGVFLPAEEPKRLEIPQVESIAAVVENYQGGQAISVGEAFDPSPENIDERTRSLSIGGIEVSLLQKENSGNTVTLNIALRYGNENSLAELSRAASMLPGMMMAGTRQYDRQQLQEKMAELGVSISAGSGRGRGRRGGGSGASEPGVLSFSIDAKKDSLVPAIELLGEILRQPAFPADEFEQSRARMISMLSRMLPEPQILATSELSRALSQYPKGDVRYVSSPEESIAEIENMSLDQVVSLYKNQVGAMVGEIAIVGDFDVVPTMAALVGILKDWKTEAEYRTIIREANPKVSGGKQNIRTPDKANAVFLSGLSFPLDESQPESVALELGNFILGGGTLSSRLGDRIRQKEGLSYGVTSSMAIPSQGDDARFTITAITNPDNIDKVETAAMEELSRFIQEGPTAEELNAAKTAWLEARKLSRTSDGSLAGQLNNNAFLDRTFAYTAEREAMVQALTADDITSAFQKYINPENLTTIRAGDF
ncbi:MAG: insulinase family protein [Planctomycetales bacterium]|nr:insulinase family protein [Planctomycetales bacterium]